MHATIDSLRHQIDTAARSLAGPEASRATIRKTRRFIGIAVLVASNVWLGALIGHGIAALLGLGVFFLALGTEDKA